MNLFTLLPITAMLSGFLIIWVVSLLREIRTTNEKLVKLLEKRD